MSEISEKEVFAAAAVLLGRVNAPEQAIYSAARAALEAAAHARAEAADPLLANPAVPEDWQERIARAWASIDGKADVFDRERRVKGLSVHPDTGTYEGYMAEARELMKRSGIMSALANPAIPEGMDRVTENIARKAFEERLGKGSWAKENDPYVRHTWIERAREAIRLVEGAGYMIAAAEKEAR